MPKNGSHRMLVGHCFGIKRKGEAPEKAAKVSGKTFAAAHQELVQKLQLS